MNEEVQKVIAVVTCVTLGYILGSTFKHNAWARRWNRRNAVELNAFGKMLEKMRDENATLEEVVAVLNEELEFVNIVLREI